MLRQLTYKNKVIGLILAGTLLRVVISATTELGNDEVYYWTYAIQPDWNHFDHPPLVGLFIRFFTFNLTLHNELFLRLTSVTAAAVNTWLIYLTGKKIKNELSGYYAALLYTSSVYCSVIAGLFILPDSPQLFFWVYAVYLMTDLFFFSARPGKMLLLGLIIGLATMCKVHGIFLWAGAGIFIIFHQRQWFRTWQLYAAVILSVAIASPILWWNIQNHFITYRFHQGRLANTGKVFSASGFLRELAGEIAYNNPVNYVLYILALVFSWRNKPGIAKQLRGFLVLISLPIIITVWFLAGFNETLPHWSGPGFIGLMLLCACVLAENRLKIRSILILRITLAVVVVALSCGWLLIHYLPSSLGNQNPEELGRGDVTIDMYGWRQLKVKFERLYHKDLADKLMSPGSFIISEKWFPAAHIDFYVAQPLDITLLGMGSLKDIHKFAWLNKERKLLMPGDDAYFITPSNFFHDPSRIYKDNFASISEPERIAIERQGKPVKYFYVYRMRHCIRTSWQGSYEWRLGAMP